MPLSAESNVKGVSRIVCFYCVRASVMALRELKRRAYAKITFYFRELIIIVFVGPAALLLYERIFRNIAIFVRAECSYTLLCMYVLYILYDGGEIRFLGGSAGATVLLEYAEGGR